MSAPRGSLSRSDTWSASERYGLKLVEQPEPPTLTKVAREEPSLEPMSISDWLVSGAFTCFVLAYVTGLGLLAHSVLRWLFST